MHHDISIHFTIKDQTVQEIDEKIEKYFTEHQKSGNEPPFDFSEETSPRTVLHHCFLPEKVVKEKGFSTDIYDVILHTTSENKVCWYGTSDYGLEWDRRLMLENLAKLKGCAIFVGELKEGVLQEYELAQELEIKCILIP